MQGTSSRFAYFTYFVAMSSLKRIAIIGLGWLGEPLAKELSEAGYAVSGTTTRQDKVARLQSEGIPAEQWIFDSSNAQVPVCLDGADIVLITLPPRRAYDTWLEALAFLSEKAAASALLIYTGSTGVYRGTESVHISKAGEGDEIPDSPLARAESVIRHSGHPYLIFRLAGLVGGERNPARFLAGKVDVKGGEAHVNLVHRVDVIRAIMLALEKAIVNETMNICSDEHPIKKDFYPALAIRNGMTPPQFDPADTQKGYQVDNSKMKSLLGIHLKYPDPYHFE
jgi:nucleoside-diphosphate-sugar epimerase